MRTTILAVVLLALLSSLATGQNHNTGWFVPGYKHLHHATMSGTVTSIAFGTSYCYAGIMNWDNKTALAFDYSTASIMKVDPNSLTVLGTFFTDPSLTSSSSVYDMDFDSNGDLFFGCSYTSPGRGVYKIGHNTLALTTVISASSSTMPFYYSENLSIDIDSGELLIADDNSSTNDMVYLLNRDGSTHTSLGNYFNFRYGTYKHILTGDIYSGTCCGSSLSTGRSILWLQGGSGTATTFLNHPVLRGGYAPCPDRASAAAQQLVTPSWRTTSTTGSDGIWKVNLASKTATKLATISTGNTLKAVPVWGRNLQSVNTGTGTWDLRLSFPTLKNQGFVVAVGMSGVRPYITLPDKRNIPLTFDTLAMLSLTTGLAPFITGNIGTLDGNGEAVVKIDVSSIGKVLNGFVIHFCGAVLDPAAPLGLAVIADPKALVIEGM